MTGIEYASGFDFANVLNEFNNEYVRFMGTTIDDKYYMNIDEDGILNINLPMDDHSGIVRKVAPLGVKKNIVLPRKMNFLGDVTNLVGKMVRFKRTLEDCTIVNRYLDDDFKIVGKRIDMEGFFYKSTFIGFDNGLVIKNSSIEVNFMFAGSRGLKRITFENCELSNLNGLAYYSDVDEVTFVNCSFVENDNSRTTMVVEKQEADSLSDLFDKGFRTLNLKGCDENLIHYLMQLHGASTTYFDNLEINILD